MKHLLQLFLCSGIVLFTWASNSAAKPNIVFVLADDLGWAELGCYGNTFNETPNLDRMAKEGTRFTQAYAAAPVCSPYRAALLTGQHPARLGILDYLRPNSANRLSTDLNTLPELLKGNGYATGMIGKWHLTGYRFQDAEQETRPRDHGFDWNIGSEVKGVGNGANTWPYVFRTQPIRWLDIPVNRMGKDENLSDRLNLEAVDFIERNRDKPFFLYLAHYAPHSILNGRPDLVEKYRSKHAPGKSGRANCYICEDAGLGKGDPGNHWAVDHNPHLAAMLEGIDDGIGQIRSKLAELKLLENTIFIFTSDNGGESNVTSNAPFRGGKSELYEGGIRVPLIVQWPNAVPAGGVSDEPTVNTDFFPSLLEATGIAVDNDQSVDGVSMLANWKQPTQMINRDAIHWHYPLDRPHFLGGFSGGAVLKDDWKLIERFDSGKTELYHLANDPSEQTDRSVDRPEKVAELKTNLADWRKRVSARTPSAPLLTEPRQLYFAEHFSGKASERFWYNGDWSAENGILNRIPTGSENTRIFLRDAEFGEVLIRFDFQLQKSKDIRLLTGSHGHYNAVIHIRPDQFYVQTAKDETGPYFSYRHGECAYNFDPDRWYTMTIEIIGNQLVAHIDREHVVYATHPILDKERTYFAFQVDDQAAAFDNVQILSVRKHREQATNLAHIRSVADRHPVKKLLENEYNISKSNAHEWLYQRHAEYRDLIRQLDEFDELKQSRFPAAFSSHKKLKKEVANLRKKLGKEDPDYKALLHATHRANRALDTYLIEQKPEVAEYPDSRRKAEIERLRRQHRDSPGYQELVAASKAAQSKLEATYPEAFITDDTINQSRKREYEKLRENPEYRQLQSERAAAFRAQQTYLFTNGPGLAKLRQQLDLKR
jgi:arylsulfatase A